MSPDTPVFSLDECFAYLQNNAWQFPMLEPKSPVTVNAQMLRSLYFHIGCVKFGVPFEDNIQQLSVRIALLANQQKATT